MLHAKDRNIAYWLLICCALVFCMIVLGGVTRLTGSGLSMVEWEPIMGIIPPLNHIQWQNTFELYQQYPEYQHINTTMDIEGFKSIFWLEYLHRLLGRLIGIVFLLPFLFFVFKKKVDKSLAKHFIFLLFLGGLQGLLGWYMVTSGLTNDPHVSQYRLTSHLTFAVFIYLYMLWIALSILRQSRCTQNNEHIGIKQASWLILTLVTITIISGGFVAGLKAGFAYNTFPLMAGSLIPDHILVLQPAWRNFFENVATVQFQHRVLAITTFTVIASFWIYIRINAVAYFKKEANLLLFFATLQVILGVSTLLLVVPTTLAALHQATAILLVSISLYTVHSTCTPSFNTDR